MAEFVNFPTTTCGNGLHVQLPAREPVFHFIQSDGTHGVAGLPTVRMWAWGILDGTVSQDEIYRELYVILPNTATLRRCEIAPDEGTGGFVVRETSSGRNRLYTCEP